MCHFHSSYYLHFCCYKIGACLQYLYQCPSIKLNKNATSFMNLLLDSENNLSLDNLESQSSLGSVIHLVALRQTASHLTMLHLVRGFKVSIEYLSKGLT